MELEKIYKIGKERIEYRREHFSDYQLRFSLVQAGSKKKVVKWISEDEFLDFDNLKELVDRKVIASIDSTLLPNEIVVEADLETKVLQNSLLNLIRKELQKLNLKYVMVYSGGKSVHFHFYLKEYDRSRLNKIKDALYQYLSERIPNLDRFGFKENHPYRLPYSYHPETMNKAEILVDDYMAEYFNPDQLIIESEVPKAVLQLLEKPKTVTRRKIIAKPSGKPRSKLLGLYEELLRTKIEDGRDRVLMILFTIANFLKIPKDKFAKDIEEWATLNEWKEYRWRPWVRYYLEERYKDRPWASNWKWAIKEFIAASDISEGSYKRVREIIEKYLPWAIEIYSKLKQ